MNVQLVDLYKAYRKAKADAFLARSTAGLADFAQYESDLAANLRRLQERLAVNESSTHWYSDPSFIGGFTAIPKSYIPPDGPSPSDGFYATNPLKEWELLPHDAKTRHRASFRIMAAFSVDMLTTCALWTARVGEQIDRLLSPNVYGARLRRYRNGQYHLDAVGSFERYYLAYSRWRQNGLEVIRRELAADGPIIAVTMDIDSFYHRVDPEFLLNPGLLGRLCVSVGVPPRQWQASEESFNRDLVAAIATWGRQVRAGLGLTADVSVGLPVGPGISSILANALLAPFDADVSQNLNPLFYGRYIDDLFIVMKNPLHLHTQADVMTYVQERVASLKTADAATQELKIDLADHQARSVMVLSHKKQRVFSLDGRTGLDFLGSIEAEIKELSSERQLMPDPDQLDSSTAAKILTATRAWDVKPDSLRKADGLSVRRYGLSVMLAQCEIVATDLPPPEWTEGRHRLFDLIRCHVFVPQRVLDYFDSFGRIIGIAVAASDWAQLETLVRSFLESVQQLRQSDCAVTLAGQSGLPDPAKVWDSFQRHIQLLLRQAIARALPTPLTKGKLIPEKVVAILRMTDTSVDVAGFIKEANLLLEADLARTSYKDWMRAGFGRSSMLIRDGDGRVKDDLVPVERRRYKGMREFLIGARTMKGSTTIISKQRSYVALLFPTRPHSAAEISLAVPECCNDVRLWARLVRALRGTFVRIPPKRGNGGRTVTVVGGKKRTSGPRIVVPSFQTDNKEWAAAAAGSPVLSRGRYGRFVRLVNAVLKTYPLPDYCVLPELSVPREWIRSISWRLAAKNVSLIAGVEYRRVLRDRKPSVINEAVLALTDWRLGYKNSMMIVQRKTRPALHEAGELRDTFGLGFAEPVLRGPTVYVHNGFYFSVFICSEVTDIARRSELRGRVDSEFVLSWNKDLETFATLVEASALDVHSFVVLVNNRLYGDSRVRGPMKEAYQRDVCRIRGGIDDYFVVVELDIHALRAFQSRSSSAGAPGAIFKPVPDGFVISNSRRVKIPSS